MVFACVCVREIERKKIVFVCVYVCGETDIFYCSNKLIKLKHEIPTSLEIVTLRFIEVTAAGKKMKYIYYD